MGHIHAVLVFSGAANGKFVGYKIGSESFLVSLELLSVPLAAWGH